MAEPWHRDRGRPGRPLRQIRNGEPGSGTARDRVSASKRTGWRRCRRRSAAHEDGVAIPHAVFALDHAELASARFDVNLHRSPDNAIRFGMAQKVGADFLQLTPMSTCPGHEDTKGDAGHVVELVHQALDRFNVDQVGQFERPRSPRGQARWPLEADTLIAARKSSSAHAERDLLPRVREKPRCRTA